MEKENLELQRQMMENYNQMKKNDAEEARRLDLLDEVRI